MLIAGLIILLDRSAGISDLGMLAVARGCVGLEMINIAYCNRITDGSFVSLSKCSKLNTLESRSCPFVTSFGLAAVAVGCKQLTKLDIKNCRNIDDAGMIPLAHFSLNLKQVTTVSLSLNVMFDGVKHWHLIIAGHPSHTQINLSYTSVTDVGLLSLASISSLQNITILHLKGLSPGGLGAALLACGGLTKVKLQTSFKPLLPQPLLQHLEARGCVFQWREKPFQVLFSYDSNLFHFL